MSIGGWMAFIMAVASARSDATPEQMVRLKDELIPAMRDPEVPSYAVVLFLWDIMGDGWNPDGEWAQWIDSLVGEKP